MISVVFNLSDYIVLWFTDSRGLPVFASHHETTCINCKCGVSICNNNKVVLQGFVWTVWTLQYRMYVSGAGTILSELYYQLTTRCEGLKMKIFLKVSPTEDLCLSCCAEDIILLEKQVVEEQTTGQAWQVGCAKTKVTHTYHHAHTFIKC